MLTGKHKWFVFLQYCLDKYMIALNKIWKMENGAACNLLQAYSNNILIIELNYLVQLPHHDNDPEFL